MKFTDRQTETLYLLSITIAGALGILCVVMDPLWSIPQPNGVRLVTDVQSRNTQQRVAIDTHVVDLTSLRNPALPPQ